MREIVIATKNPHKILEFKNMLEPLGYTIYTLFDFPEVKDIIEDGDTFEENAYIKVKTLQHLLHKDVIADDSGLMVDALDGAPGIYSARYAGEDVDYNDNNKLLLQNMKDVSNRQAHFITAMCYLPLNQEPHYFTGTLDGRIATTFQGHNGFGYDPIFVLPDGRHLAELSMNEKNSISHRSKALQQLMMHLNVQG